MIISTIIVDCVSDAESYTNCNEVSNGYIFKLCSILDDSYAHRNLDDKMLYMNKTNAKVDAYTYYNFT